MVGGFRVFCDIWMLDAVLHFLQIGICLRDLQRNRLARSRRCGGRRTVEPLHPHGVEEPAEPPDLSRQPIAPRFNGDVVGVERSLRIDRVGRQDGLRLNLQIGRARVEGAVRRLGGATARKRDGRGER